MSFLTLLFEILTKVRCQYILLVFTQKPVKETEFHQHIQTYEPDHVILFLVTFVRQRQAWVNMQFATAIAACILKAEVL